MPNRLIHPGPGAWPHAPDTPAAAQGGQPVCASTSGCDAFIARQPILDRAQRVIGYELLFRASDMADRFSGSPEVASARVIADALGSFGLDVMTHGRLAFINLTRSMLLDSVTRLLPPKGVVLELLEQIDADDEVLACCRDLKEKGYTLALDDFLPSAANRELIPLVDYVKVDLAAVVTCRRGCARCRMGTREPARPWRWLPSGSNRGGFPSRRRSRHDALSGVLSGQASDAAYETYPGGASWLPASHARHQQSRPDAGATRGTDQAGRRPVLACASNRQLSGVRAAD
jgi:hypothetical protein